MMPAYNAERFIGLAIESALVQTYPYWELIIVNDGSTDQTAQIAAKYNDPRIKIYHHANGGEAAARNTALQYLNGEYIAFLDADDIFLPDHLETAVSFLQTHKDYDGVYTDGYYCDIDGIRLQTLSSRRRGPFEGDIFEEMVRASDVFGAPVCVVLRREIVAKHELWFDTGIVIGPDWDFLTRYSEVGKFGYILQTTCLYRVHQTNISLRTDSQRRALYLAKCRENAIQLTRFKTCSLATREFVFYDLLVNLLTGFPDRQLLITEGDEFRRLPAGSQARLFRLMANKALLGDVENSSFIKECFRLSRELNPSDKRSTFLYMLYQFNPKLCKTLLKARATAQKEPVYNSPFGNLGPQA